MNFLNDIFSETIIYSLGWTFVHSLWQSGIICLISSLLLLLYRKQNSKVRYLISTSALVSILLLAAYTFSEFYSYYDQYFLARDSGLSSNATSSANEFNFLLFNLLPNSILDNLNYFNNQLPLIFTVWLVGVSFLAIKYLGGYTYSQRLKHYRITKPNIFWQNFLDDLADKINLKKSVKLFESALVKVPVVIGYFKPAILLPVGLVSGLPHNQIEAILTHELAHIFRRDYLVNLIQTIVEVIFFFNPFVWWISSVIKTEREHCCDDIAISHFTFPLVILLSSLILLGSSSVQTNIGLEQEKKTVKESRLKKENKKDVVPTLPPTVDQEKPKKKELTKKEKEKIKQMELTKKEKLLKEKQKKFETVKYKDMKQKEKMLKDKKLKEKKLQEKMTKDEKKLNEKMMKEKKMKEIKLKDKNLKEKKLKEMKLKGELKKKKKKEGDPPPPPPPPKK
jgi:beta-lactamase regulating signal transducer with metallopeptidase domain